MRFAGWLQLSYVDRVCYIHGDPAVCRLSVCGRMNCNNMHFNRNLWSGYDATSDKKIVIKVRLLNILNLVGTRHFTITSRSPVKARYNSPSWRLDPRRACPDSGVDRRTERQADKPFCLFVILNPAEKHIWSYHALWVPRFPFCRSQNLRAFTNVKCYVTRVKSLSVSQRNFENLVLLSKIINTSSVTTFYAHWKHSCFTMRIKADWTAN